MKILPLFRRCAAAAVFLSAASLSQAQMKFAVDNQSGQSKPVWVLFFTGGTAVDGTYYSISQKQTVSLTPTTVGSTNAVLLSDVAVDPATGLPTFDISAFNGQMWFSYGDTAVDFTNGAPSPTATAPALIDNFNKRWQFIEPTVNQPTGNPASTRGVDVDQTIIDFFSIPITVAAYSAPNTKATSVPFNTQTAASTNAIVSALAGSTLTPSTFPNIYNSNTPSGGPIVNPTSLPDANFARAVSPTQAPSLYHDWSDYMAALAPGGELNAGGTLKIHLADNFVGSGAGSGNGFQAQYYDLEATVAAGSKDVTITGATYTDSTKTTPVIEGLVLTSTFADLNATTGIYGNAAAFDWTSTTPMTTFANSSASTSGSETASANDILGRIMGDMLAGLSMGYPGSTFGSTTASGTWWANPDKAFGAAQTNSKYYNTWAAALQPLASSYGLGYEDRFGQNLLSFANGSNIVGYSGNQVVTDGFLVITLHPDTGDTPVKALKIQTAATVKVKGKRGVLKVDLSTDGTLKATASGHAKVKVRGNNPYRVVVSNIDRKVTRVHLTASDSEGQHAKKTVKIIRR